MIWQSTPLGSPKVIPHLLQIRKPIKDLSRFKRQIYVTLLSHLKDYDNYTSNPFD